MVINETNARKNAHDIRFSAIYNNNQKASKRDLFG